MSRYNLTTDKTWSQTLDDLAETFRKWSVSSWSVEPTNPGRRAANRFQSLDERTVKLRYTKRGQQVELTMHEQDRAVDNLRVLYLAVEALRLNELRGLGATIAEAARQMYPALPAPGQSTPAPSAATPYRLLYVLPNAPLEVCEAAYRALAKMLHPDAAAGDAQAFMAISQAIEAIRKERERDRNEKEA